jgi:hypothetical protein
MSQEPESYWTAVANIVRERPYSPGGAEIRLGTKHFAPGAKVYIIDWYAGMCERIIVVGQHRKSKHLIAIVIDVKLVENLRAKLCYAPAVLAKIKEYHQSDDLTFLTAEFADTLCKTIPFWQAQPWRQPQPAPVVPESATLRLLREATSNSATSASGESESALQPTTEAFSPSLWQRLSRLLRGS